LLGGKKKDKERRKKIMWEQENATWAANPNIAGRGALARKMKTMIDLLLALFCLLELLVFS